MFFTAAPIYKNLKICTFVEFEAPARFFKRRPALGTAPEITPSGHGIAAPISPRISKDLKPDIFRISADPPGLMKHMSSKTGLLASEISI